MNRSEAILLSALLVATPTLATNAMAASDKKPSAGHKAERTIDSRDADSPSPIRVELDALQAEVGSLRAEVAALGETDAPDAAPMNNAMTTMRIALVIMGLGLGVALFEIRRLKKGLAAPQKNNA